MYIAEETDENSSFDPKKKKICRFGFTKLDSFHNLYGIDFIMMLCKSYSYVMVKSTSSPIRCHDHEKQFILLLLRKEKFV